MAQIIDFAMHRRSARDNADSPASPDVVTREELVELFADVLRSEIEYRKQASR